MEFENGVFKILNLVCLSSEPFMSFYRGWILVLEPNEIDLGCILKLVCPPTYKKG